MQCIKWQCFNTQNIWKTSLALPQKKKMGNITKHKAKTYFLKTKIAHALDRSKNDQVQADSSHDKNDEVENRTSRKIYLIKSCKKSTKKRWLDKIFNPMNLLTTKF